MTDNHQPSINRQAGRTVNHTGDRTFATQIMQDLGQIRFHPRPFTGS
jgi:hypothetical protein